MHLLLKSGLPLNCWSFGIIIDAFALSDAKLCRKYFKLMTETFKIKPNVVIFSSLIKAFRINEDYKSAQKY